MTVRVALVAEEAAGTQAFERCARSGLDLALLLSAEASSARPGSRLRVLATEHGVDVHGAASVRDPAFADTLRERGIDVLLNVHSLHLIHRDVLAAPRLGTFNLHPGPLPEYAGLNTVSWAICERAAEYGATLHWVEPGIDTGAIAYETRFPLTPDLTAARLMGRAVREGMGLLDRFLAQLATDPAGIPARPQDTARRRYYDRSVPGNGRVDWAWPAAHIEAFVRACDYDPFPSPWGRPIAPLGGTDIRIVRASLTATPTTNPPGTIEHASDDGLVVAAGDEGVLITRALVADTALAGPALARHFAASTRQ